MRIPLLARSIAGTVAYTTISIGMITLPLAMVTSILNCTPFFTAVIVALFLKKCISMYEGVAMIGSFLGVILIAFGTPNGENTQNEQLQALNNSILVDLTVN